MKSMEDRVGERVEGRVGRKVADAIGVERGVAESMGGEGEIAVVGVAQGCSSAVSSR